MSNILRVFSKHARSLTQSSNTRIIALERSFHSPFVVLNSPASNASPVSASQYEKQHDHSPEPQISSAGTRTYVVSEPDPADTPYAVPSGAYPTTTPYVNFRPTGKYSAGSASIPHSFTTRAIPRSKNSVDESTYGEAPNGMELRDRNPFLDSDVVLRWSKLGVEGAWKERK
ncbi:uncharacterized protein HD556DRAFT_1429161 [Suillus plorans]|uniref:Uncharacterized protein n=1 Tax=Suillus plorans TaxID=116603 RepID=A0A9P7DWZ4_9AGAM|nr:uncharacterized protein HD556DRAFT_1429161 [Suillus plorans]KAG1805070.1 hypothetical protein HD556DRAFT_1429161 [Suillus plorans]